MKGRDVAASQTLKEFFRRERAGEVTNDEFGMSVAAGEEVLLVCQDTPRYDA
jgi:hypothetical protein